MTADKQKRQAFHRAGELVGSYLTGVPLPTHATVTKSLRKQFGRPNPEALLHFFGLLCESKGDLDFDADSAWPAVKAAESLVGGDEELTDRLWRVAGTWEAEQRRLTQGKCVLSDERIWISAAPGSGRGSGPGSWGQWSGW